MLMLMFLFMDLFLLPVNVGNVRFIAVPAKSPKQTVRQETGCVTHPRTGDQCGHKSDLWPQCKIAGLTRSAGLVAA